MLPPAPSRVENTMSQTSPISSHMLTPRWTHAIDVRAQSRREDAVSLVSLGLSLLAVLRDQPVPLPPVPRADLPRRHTPRPQKSVPIKGPTPLSVPQEIETPPDLEANPAVIFGPAATDY
jgi:hypothetical protein